MRTVRQAGLALVILLAVTAALQADLKRAMAEPDLEKRSKLALDNAFAAYQSARDQYLKGELEQSKIYIDEIGQSVELAYQSLNATGKNPRRSPKYFKSAELSTRDLVRRLAGFQEQMSYDDRHLLDPLKERVQQVHDELLLGLMEGKKR